MSCDQGHVALCPLWSRAPPCPLCYVAAKSWSGVDARDPEEDSMAEPEDAMPAQLEQLQEVRPVWELQGHEVCADVHVALSVAQAVLKSRDERVADHPDESPGDALLRELRALGVAEASA